MLNELTKLIKRSKSFVLSSHKEMDGDGLGSVLALFHALKKMNKEVSIYSVDPITPKYNFLDNFEDIIIYKGETLPKTEVALVCDTSERKLLEPLFTELENSCDHIAFLDHHTLKISPEESNDLYSSVDPSLSSTGEIIYQLLELLDVKMDQKIARAIYTSIVFDSQLFTAKRVSSKTHLICSELLKHEKNPHEIHQHIFSDYTPAKIKFLSYVLGNIEYPLDGNFALVSISLQDLKKFQVESSDTFDIVDLINKLKTIKVSGLLREIRPQEYKLSLRGARNVEVLRAAESFGGGGHLLSCGAQIQGELSEIKGKLITEVQKILP